jgi:acetyl esterase/lipase
MHGGGYRIGSRNRSVRPQRDAYIQMGWNAVNVEYRASGIAQAPERLKTRVCLRWVIHTPRNTNVDTDRNHRHRTICRFTPRVDDRSRSRSAVLIVIVRPRPLKVAAVISWGVRCVRLHDARRRSEARLRNQLDWRTAELSRHRKARLTDDIRARGAAASDGNHGDADPIVPYEQEVREIEALKKAGGVAELVTIPGGGHGKLSTRSDDSRVDGDRCVPTGERHQQEAGRNLGIGPLGRTACSAEGCRGSAVGCEAESRPLRLVVEGGDRDDGFLRPAWRFRAAARGRVECL